MRVFAFCSCVHGGPKPAAHMAREVWFFIHNQARDHLAATATIDVCFFGVQLVAELAEDFFDKGKDFYGVPVAGECEVVGIARVVDPVAGGDFRDSGIRPAKNQVSDGWTGGSARG